MRTQVPCVKTRAQTAGLVVRHRSHFARRRCVHGVQTPRVHIATTGQALLLARYTGLRPCHVCSSSSTSSSYSSVDGDDYLPGLSEASPSNDSDSATSASSSSSSSSTQQHEQQQQSLQQQSRSPEQLQMDYLRAQAAKLQALEQYQQLMQQHPPSPAATPSSSSSSSSKTSSSSSEDPQLQQQHSQAADISVLDAALLIAKHAHPDLDPQHVKQQLDQLAAEVEANLPSGVRYPLRIIKEINRVLYEQHGFKGNEEDYYNPNNSYINQVLETKKGIPISLSIIYIEVAARLGLPMAGVNLPAHFMIRPQVDGMELLVDAFHSGELTALEDAEEVLGKLMGYQVKLDPRFVRGDTPYFSSRQLLLRLLNNLRQIYMTLNMPEEALWIVRFMRATAPPGHLTELQRDEGMCLYGLGRFHEASEVLVEYLRSSPGNGDEDVVMAILQRIKERAGKSVAGDDLRGRSGDSD